MEHGRQLRDMGDGRQHNSKRLELDERLYVSAESKREIRG